jgi:hypothetical protein
MWLTNPVEDVHALLHRPDRVPVEVRRPLLELGETRRRRLPPPPSALDRRLTSLPCARSYVWMSVNWPVPDRFA